MSATAQDAVVCSRCDRRIDLCAVCEKDACGERICYRCVLVALKETKRHPHDHGG